MPTASRSPRSPPRSSSSRCARAPARSTSRTFSITNVGPLGGKGLIPTINYPEVAILGMGRAEPRPVVRDGQVVVRTILPLTLTFDHRIADGADAARFMTAVIRRLSDPLGWLLEA
jgi:pyruvate dehydrogenase E2 component (dihydrolipoamide acetyltransferase)